MTGRAYTPALGTGVGYANSVRRWRLLTAARVFSLATALGLAAATSQAADVAASLLALCVLATVMCLPIPAPGWRVVGPLAEAALAGLMVAPASGGENPLLAYLLVPPFVAGLQAGVRWAVATVLTACGAAFAALLTTDQLEHLRAASEQLAPWVLVGLGIGLLGAWMRTSVSTSPSEQERYASAHRLLAQLHAVARDLPHGLDAPSLAQRTLGRAVASVDSDRAMLILRGAHDSLYEAAVQGPQQFGASPLGHPLVEQCWATGDVQQGSVESAHGVLHRAALPVRVGHRPVGVMVLDTPARVGSRALRTIQSGLDEQSLRLESALFFEQVRSMATVEERHRLAREIHDGIAQEVASLGYLVDDLAATTEGPEAREAAQRLRTELSRIVNELRFSIFDLRMDVSQHGGLAQALSDYARDVGSRSGLTVHLALAESGHRLAVDVETELLRIAQEAITNARKHARAHNLWVTLNTGGDVAVLRIEDDGIGSAKPRSDHYGLQMMRERADRIGAELAIAPRPRGGTSVVVALQPSQKTPGGAHRADLDLAG